MIRVLIADDSKLVAFALQEIFSKDPEIIVVGVAANGLQAVEMTKKLKPNVVTMDLSMPQMDGFEATRQIMAECPTPILIVSSLVAKSNDKVFKAMSYGALDVIDKGLLETGEQNEGVQSEFIEKVKMLSKTSVMRHVLKNIESSLGKSLAKQNETRVGKFKAVGIVSSTGGPQALRILLKSIPADFPCPIVLVQHMTTGFLESFVDWLNEEIPLKVKIGEAGETIKPGFIYTAPSDLHMVISSEDRIVLKDSPALEFQKPSGTLLLESLAAQYGANCMGVILTGMGSDGAKGIKAIYDRKGMTIAQDEESSIIFGMPKAAIDLGAVHEVVGLDKIADAILKDVQT